jgi:hypothetical protein
MGTEELENEYTLRPMSYPHASLDLRRSTELHPKRKPEMTVSQIERVLSRDIALKDHMDYDRVDKEVAKYASAARIEITGAENVRLKRLIDRRVLPIMIFTYFLQALDKGTLSFASIMGIKTDVHLVGQQV